LGGNAPSPGRCGHAAVSQGQQNMLIMGGRAGNLVLEDQHSLNVERERWHTVALSTAATPFPRVYFRACALQGIEWATFLFGGTDGSAVLADIWRFMLSTDNTGTWRRLRPRGAAPCGRMNHAMAAADSRLFIHGGDADNETLLDDLWTFDPTATTWQQIEASDPGPRPPPRCSHCLAWLEEPGLLIVFGGLMAAETAYSAVDSGGGGGGGADSWAPTNDLWTLSMDAESGSSDSAWRHIVFDSIGPSPRSLSAVAVRPGSGIMFLFGGHG
ncbi:unnamed protein product, partial [Phaeothamnion confervicola]